jgi:enoyl-CoA hydratase
VREAGGGIVVERQGGLLNITFDGAHPGNSIDRAVRDQLHEALMLGAADPEIGRIVVAAHGRSFSMGADLGEFGTTRDPVQAHAIRWQTLPARAAAFCADRLEAHIDGACVGAGLELAAWSRTVLASERAWFQLPELAMGVLPGAGGCVALTRRIGRQRAALLILSGKRLSARQALGWGLIDAVVDQFPA